MRKRRARHELELLLTEIRRHITVGVTPQRIAKELNISPQMMSWYMAKIYDEDKKELQRLRSKIFEHEIINTKNRLMRTINKMDALSDNDNTLPKDKIEAERLKKECTLDIIRLLKEGPELVANEESGHHSVPEDTVVSDEFVKFAESTTAEKFTRT